MMDKIETIRARVPLRRVLPASAIEGMCPFCGDKGSFHVDELRGIYDCTWCFELGDVVLAHALVRDISYDAAIRELSEMAEQEQGH